MLDAFMNALKRRNNYKLTYNELYRLSDRELSDLGLCRGDIRHIAYETSYGKEAF